MRRVNHSGNVADISIELVTKRPISYRRSSRSKWRSEVQSRMVVCVKNSRQGIIWTRPRLSIIIETLQLLDFFQDLVFCSSLCE